MSQYTHLSQRNQILKRPGQHINSAKCIEKKVWLFQDNKFVEKQLVINPGLLHIFYEVLGNAQDNYFRSKDTDTPLKKIEITVDQNTVTIWNDGKCIPTVIHQWDKDEEKLAGEHYEAEIIFGHLNSSSNYNDETVKRIGGGLHGVGVKLTNIFSQKFQVETFDPNTGLKFFGEWSDNMNEFKKPKITSLKQKKGWTKVSYVADFKRFGVENYTDDYLAVMKKMATDCALLAGQKVIFNGESIPVRDLRAYSKMYFAEEPKFMEFKSADTTVILCEKTSFDMPLAQVSFVNGILTSMGGVHVEEWRKAIFKPLFEKIKAKYTKGKNSTPIKLTLKTLEQYFVIFVVCNVENPEFSNQTKDYLISPTPKVETITPTKITNIMKWGFLQDIEETIRVMGMKELKKTDGKKATTVDIPKAVDANNAGKAKSKDCVLFITEGLSAKTFAKKGISTFKNGTDLYGVLPIKGKFLNVRGAPATQIKENKEICYLKQILGLKHGVDYTLESNYKTLRYGSVCILTDADADGDHIKGLLLNFFQFFYPSLIQRGYITSLRTPIVKATIGKRIENFYYLKDFKDWADKQTTTTRWSAKYYKGLGTSIDSEIYEIFKKPRYVDYIQDTDCEKTVAMIFDKKKAEERKKWLEKYVEKDFTYSTNTVGKEQVPISKFFNNEMIMFSISDNKRSIPSVVDGLKPSQRKALWVGCKILTNSESKVEQFAGEISKMAAYHHGATSMEQTIIGMAQTFVGSNNIAYFKEIGQFGTRESGGKDAAAGRYISTKLATITRFIFRKEDDPVLDYLNDEGQDIEPQFFVPIIPTILVNGATGIGTAWSTDIPCYNPLDLVDWLKCRLTASKCNNDLIPWYNSFTGTIEPTEKGKYKVSGSFESTSNEFVYKITELPIGVWTEDYDQLLNSLKTEPKEASKTGYENCSIEELKEQLAENKLSTTGTKAQLMKRLVALQGKAKTALIKDWAWKGDPYKIDYLVTCKKNVDPSETRFKLTSCLTTSNMTAFNENGGITRYKTVADILENYYNIRLSFYDKRKSHLLAHLLNLNKELDSKVKFIGEVLKDYSILKQTEDDLFNYFTKQQYWKKNDSYNYLTDLQIRYFTQDKYNSLKKELENNKREIDYIKKTPIKEMWLKELDEFIVAYKKWLGSIKKSQSNEQ